MTSNYTPQFSICEQSSLIFVNASVQILSYTMDEKSSFDTFIFFAGLDEVVSVLNVLDEKLFISIMAEN